MAGTLALAMPVYSGNVTVENNISSRANSGGNTLRPGSGQDGKNGQVTRGKSWVDIEIKSVLNGEVIEDTKIHEESGSKPIVIDRKIENERGDAKSVTKINVEIGATSSNNSTDQIINKLIKNNEQTENQSPQDRQKGFFKRIFERIISIFKF